MSLYAIIIAVRVILFINGGCNVFKKKIRYTILVTCVFVTTVIFIVTFLHQKPLVIGGYTEYGNDRNKVDVELINKGNSHISINEVIVNGTTAEEVKLVLSYTLQLVAGGIDGDLSAKFVPFNQEVIHPQLSPAALAKLEYPHTQPINYGVRIVSDTNIQTVKIKYKYKGFPFTRELDLDHWVD